MSIEDYKEKIYLNQGSVNELNSIQERILSDKELSDDDSDYLLDAISNLKDRIISDFFDCV